MRIIAGEHRGRNLLGPESGVTRPITDRAKQSLFDILAPLIPDAVVYDCFAGTGSMGLECLSRGARSVLFFEMDRSALQRLRDNIQTLREESRSQIVAGDIFKWFAVAKQPQIQPAELIFLDPPYRFLRDRPDDLQKLVQRIADSHLSAAGLLIFRHDAADELRLAALREVDRREYGGMTIEFLKRT